MGKLKILVVEDDEFLREIYVDTLKTQNYEVDFAVDGEQALSKIRENKWDLVLLDIVLPKIDGLEVIRQIKSSGNAKFDNFVFLTNLDTDHRFNEALKLGKGYLIKNKLTPEDLIREVKKFLTPKLD